MKLQFRRGCDQFEIVEDETARYCGLQNGKKVVSATEAHLVARELIDKHFDENASGELPAG